VPFNDFITVLAGLVALAAAGIALDRWRRRNRQRSRDERTADLTALRKARDWMVGQIDAMALVLQGRIGDARNLMHRFQGAPPPELRLIGDVAAFAQWAAALDWAFAQLPRGRVGLAVWSMTPGALRALDVSPLMVARQAVHRAFDEQLARVTRNERLLELDPEDARAVFDLDAFTTRFRQISWLPGGSALAQKPAEAPVGPERDT
jgi:hypothetical protein